MSVSLPQAWVQTFASASAEAIDREIARLTRGEQLNQERKREDDHLTALKEQVKEQSAPYREATQYYKAYMKYLLGRPACQGTPLPPALGDSSGG